MKISRKKKGSSLIFVIIIFMFITVVSTGMLLMVAGNYKARAVESDRVKNLYGAESGLDIAYNVISKTIDNSSKFGYYRVEEFLDDVADMSYDDFELKKSESNEIEKCKAYLYALYQDIDYEENINNNQDKINKDNENIDKLINHVFRIYFLDYINPDDNLNKNENLINNILGSANDGTEGKFIKDIKSEYNESNLNKIPYNNAAIAFKDGTLDNGRLSISKSDEIDVPKSKVELIVNYYYKRNIKGDGSIEYELVTTPFNDFQYKHNERITIPINLVSKFKEHCNIGENERKIEVLYTLTVPNYNEVAFKNSVVTGVSELPGITIGGNLTVNGSLDVKGDIMVEGNDEGNVSLNNKYNNGIIISNRDATKNTINFYNNVLCRKTFKVMDNVDVNINKNLYAKNLYVNSSSDKGSYLGIKESGSEVILNNDLEMNSKNAKVDIENFYGINDKTNSNNGQKDEKAQNSSSIIINSAENSTLLIENEAYIRGVAHINTENGYQTGESVAVKGNYNAYSVPLDQDDKFIYDEPLQLLDDEFDNKIDHFFNYWRKDNPQENTAEAKDELNYGGVFFKNIDNVHSIGNIVYKELNSDTKKIKKADDDGTKSEFYTKITDKKKSFAENVYNLNVPEGNKKDKEYNFDIDNYRHIDKIKNILNTQYKSDSFKENSLWYIKSGNGLNNEPEFKGILIAAGDLTITEDFDLEGNLIVIGNLNIQPGVKVNLKYDREKTHEIQNYNLSKLDKILPNYGKDVDLDNPKEITESNSTIFIESSLWKIIK